METFDFDHVTARQSLVYGKLSKFVGQWPLEVMIWEKQEAQRATYRAPEYNMPPFCKIGQGGNFCLLIGLKNTN